MLVSLNPYNCTNERTNIRTHYSCIVLAVGWVTDESQWLETGLECWMENAMWAAKTLWGSASGNKANWRRQRRCQESCHGSVFLPPFVTNNHKIYLLEYAPHRSTKNDCRKPRQLSVRIDDDFFFIVKHQLNAIGAEKELAASCVLSETCEWMWICVKMTQPWLMSVSLFAIWMVRKWSQK